MRITERIEEARKAHDEAVEELAQVSKELDELAEDADDQQRDFLKDAYKGIEEKVAQLGEKLEREVALQRGREAAAAVLKAGKVSVGDEPKTYRLNGPNSWFRDLVRSSERVRSEMGWSDDGATERLRRHGEELIADKIEVRDVTSADPGVASFIPPLYMRSMWIDKELAGRQFADSIASIPLSRTGQTMSFPRVQTAPVAAIQASEGAAVNELDFDSETYSVAKKTIAGQNDLSIQAFEFADPGMDVVIMRELVKSYNSVLDSQLLSGSGASGQHLGLRNVAGINAVTFTSPVNAAVLVGKIYDAQSQISTNAPGYEADRVVMHPRRASWIASHRDASGTLFQQASYLTQVGSQDRAFAENVAGLLVVRDANIATNLGAGTNEDEIYVYASQELMLAESDLRARVLTEVLSNTLQVKLQVYAFSAAPLGRRPKVITRISGAGLVPPTFPSS